MRNFLDSKPFKLIFTAIFLAFIAASCSTSAEDDNIIYNAAKALIYKQYNEQTNSLNYDYEEAKYVLSKLGDKVEITSTAKDRNNKSVVFFYFTQMVDHNDPSKGTFQQYCALHYKGRDNITILETNGYSIWEEKNYLIEDMADVFDTNYLEVEHRYFKRSGIDLKYDTKSAAYWQYNTAEQATADLHDIVTAFKETSEFNGKWISTGLSKNGILTSLYAYKYPNDMDVYVPFCAPFLNELESLSVGKYLSEESGKNDVIDEETGETVHDRTWKCLTDYLENPGAQQALWNLAKANSYEGSEAEFKSYITTLYMANAFAKFSYSNVTLWTDVIPLYENYETDAEGQQLYANCFFIFANLNHTNFKEAIVLLRELNGLTEDSRSLNSYEKLKIYPPEEVVEIAYFIQAAKELGYYTYDWSYLKDRGLLSDDEIEAYRESIYIKNIVKGYDVEYDNGALMNGFFDFLAKNSSKDKCRMVFVYGENDPWTGGAIPDNLADDTYIKKILIKKGVHSSNLNSQLYYSQEDREKVVSAISNFLQ